MLILFLLATLVIAIIGVYGLKPAYKDYNQSKDSYLALNDEVERVKNNHLDMEQIRESISTLKEQMYEGDIHLPSQQFESHIISELQKLAWKNGIELTGVRPRQGQVVDHYLEVLFDVELTGDYFDLFRLLQDLEQVSGFLVINELSIITRSSMISETELEVTMSLASYRQERK